MNAFISNFKSNPALAAKITYNRHLIRQKCPRSTELRNDGIGIVAETNYIFSVSQLARDFIDKIAQTAIPFAYLNSSIPFLRHPKIKTDELKHFRALKCRRFDQRHVIHFSTIQCAMDKRFCNAITPFWEFQSGMLECRPGIFRGADVVIAYSDFLKDYLESLVPQGVKILKFRYPYLPLPREDFDKAGIRRRFNLPENSFMVFFNFDFDSCYERKNPEATLRAFATAFPSGNDTALVFKTSHAESHVADRETLQAAADKLGIAQRTHFIDAHLSRRDVIELTAASDAYISLHRGEGLGMGMLEAMSLNVPVIATAYGGNTDFVHEDTAFPVPYKLIAAHTNFGAYAHVTEWAEPDIDVAAANLKQLFADSALSQRKAAAASSFIQDYCSLEKFQADINTLIQV